MSSKFPMISKKEVSSFPELYCRCYPAMTITSSNYKQVTGFAPQHWLEEFNLFFFFELTWVSGQLAHTSINLTSPKINNHISLQWSEMTQTLVQSLLVWSLGWWPYLKPWDHVPSNIVHYNLLGHENFCGFSL